MTGTWVRRRVALSVGQRLFLGLLPSLLALALVVGLAYWGQYAHTVPGLIVAAAAVLAVASLGMTWLNTRYLAARIARLAGTGAGATLSPRASAGRTSTTDELDRIELVVDSLGSALTEAQSERARADETAAARMHEHATLLSSTVRLALARLDEVKLPLHILLEARVGELNENQEELLRDARGAADAMDEALRELGQIADADRGALPVQRELVQVNDVVRAVLPLAHAAAERHGARVDASLEPGLARVSADRVRLAEALSLLFQASAESVAPERPLHVSTERDHQRVVVTVAPTPRAADEVQDGERAGLTPGHSLALAQRLVEVQGGSMERLPEALKIRLG